MPESVNTPEHERGERETHARRKIREAVERHGMQVEALSFEPIRSGGEKSGPEGGWLVYVVGYGVASGYTWQETVECIDMLASGWLNGSIIG